MARSHSQSFTVTVRVVLAESLGPVLTELNLADPEESVHAAMDYLLPCDVSSEVLRQAQRHLLSYIGWLLDDAPARYPSWSKDELCRAVRRLVELETATETARPPLH